MPLNVRMLAGRPVVVVDGCRTPFLRSGTAFNDLTSHELGAHAVSGLLARSGLDPAEIDRVVMGTVIQEPRTSNLAREIVLATSLPSAVPAFTVSAACASANVAIATAAESIALGGADIVIADRYLPRSCKPRWLKADRKLLNLSGGLSINLAQSKIRSVAQEQGRHGWWRGGQTQQPKNRRVRPVSVIAPQQAR